GILARPRAPRAQEALAGAGGAAGPGDPIVGRAGARPFAGGFALKSGQTVMGEGASPVIAADRDVVRIADVSDVTVSNLTIHAGAHAAGIVVQNTRGVVTLRDVLVTTAGGAGIAAKSEAKPVGART